MTGSQAINFLRIPFHPGLDGKKNKFLKLSPPRRVARIQRQGGTKKYTKNRSRLQRSQLIF